MSPERTFSADIVIERTPWDVYELLEDAGMQDQWRARESVVRAEVETAQPYTRIVYADGLEFDIEPEGTAGTRLTATRRRYSRGALGGIGLALVGRRSEEDDLRALLRRVEAVLVYDV